MQYTRKWMRIAQMKLNLRKSWKDVMWCEKISLRKWVNRYVVLSCMSSIIDCCNIIWEPNQPCTIWSRVNKEKKMIRLSEVEVATYWVIFRLWRNDLTWTSVEIACVSKETDGWVALFSRNSRDNSSSSGAVTVLVVQLFVSFWRRRKKQWHGLRSRQYDLSSWTLTLLIVLWQKQWRQQQ